MTTKYVIAKFGVLFAGVLSVHNVAKVVFTLDLVLVQADKIVLGKFEGNSKQDMKGVQDLCVKQLFSGGGCP